MATGFGGASGRTPLLRPGDGDVSRDAKSEIDDPKSDPTRKHASHWSFIIHPAPSAGLILGVSLTVFRNSRALTKYLISAISILDSPAPMSFDFIPIVLVLSGFVTLVLLSLSWHLRRSVELIDQWAADNGYELVDARPRNFLRGPFFLRSSEGQSVYYITVRDQFGITRCGWARCGGWWLGLLSDSVKVKWDE